MADPRWRTKSGRLIHNGDCSFWDLRICTCGLLDFLSARGCEDLSDDILDEIAEHDNALHWVRMEKRDNPESFMLPEYSEEELEKIRRKIEKIFTEDVQE